MNMLWADYIKQKGRKRDRLLIQTSRISFRPVPA